DPGEFVRVGGLELVEHLLELNADVLGKLSELRPVGVGRDDETVVIGFDFVGEVVAEIGDSLRAFPVPRVGDPLEEQQRKDVRLEIRRIHRTPKRIRRVPKAGLEFLLCQGWQLLTSQNRRSGSGSADLQPGHRKRSKAKRLWQSGTTGFIGTPNTTPEGLCRP